MRFLLEYLVSVLPWWRITCIVSEEDSPDFVPGRAEVGKFRRLVTRHPGVLPTDRVMQSCLLWDGKYSCSPVVFGVLWFL
jgi:hypothetical protein